jgi:GPR180/TMEM145, transmembrane domain
VKYLSLLCYFVHYFQFGQDGIGLVWLSYIGAILDAVARIVFIFLLLLLAHGWTISNDHLHQRWIIATVLAAFFCLQVAQFGYAWYSFNPELTAVNRGEFVLQCMVIAIYLLLGCYFVFMLCVSWVNEIIPPKKRLYLRLGLLFSPWMIGPPLVAIGVLLLDDWVRTKIVLTLQTSLTLVAYFALSFLLWPSRAQEYFSINTPTLSDFRAAYERL